VLQGGDQLVGPGGDLDRAHGASAP
jgi:hypothetical protein